MLHKINVPDMHCENCVRRLKEALSELKIEAKIDLDSKTVTVLGCENCFETAFNEIYDLGFTPNKM